MSLYDNGPRRAELIGCIRHELNLSEADVTDEDLLERTRGTFVRARIELGMSLSQLWKELKSALGLNG